MDEKKIKDIVIDAWEKWNVEQEVAQTGPSKKRTFGQWLIDKFGIKIPEDKPRTFALVFFVHNRKTIKGLSVDSIQKWVLQKEASEALLQYQMKLFREVNLIIEPHLNTLLKKRRRMSMKDDYGFIDDAKWQKELDYFVDQAIVPHLQETITNVVEYTILFCETCNQWFESIDGGKDELKSAINDIKDDINDALDNYAEETIDQAIDVSTLDPNEYEHFCADLLKEVGWDVRVTQASGDQGIDVLAEVDGFLLALQCKKYSSPVGNKAVQEAYSGGTFYGANKSAVVSPVEYTLSARELASSLGVLLLHHDDLSSLTVTDKEQE